MRGGDGGGGGREGGGGGGGGGRGGGGGGQAAVRLIEHILINSISPPCNRPHGYLLARAPEKHAMDAILRETETLAYLGNARAHRHERVRQIEG